MVGLFIPVGIIFVVELLKYKIENRGDVEQLTNVPILGELPLCGHKSSDKGAIVVRENKNDMMEETFRGLRTNLLFMLRKDQKVILFSSTQPGEGKSFVTGNLAVSLAYLGKKVVVVGMDIRKPGLNKVFDLSKRQEGISNYLMDPEDKDLFDLVQPSGISPNLQKGIHETTEYLEAFLRNLLLNEKNELHNRNLHISGLLNEEKVDIENEKVDIQTPKVDIGSVISEKSSGFSVKTTVHIHRLFEKFGFDEVFGRSAVMELLGLKSSGASKLLSNLTQADIIGPVSGYGKGKYKFKR